MDFYFCYIKPVDTLYIKIVNDATKNIYNVHLHKPSSKSFPADLYAKIKCNVVKDFGKSRLYIPVDVSNGKVTYTIFDVNFDAICNALDPDKEYITIALNFLNNRTMLSIYFASPAATTNGRHTKYIYTWDDNLGDYVRQRLYVDKMHTPVKFLNPESEYSYVANLYLKSTV